MEDLIRCIKDHPIIYENKKTPNSVKKKKENWEEIALDLGQSVDTLKKKWSYLRENYLKAIREGKDKKWHWGKEMEFLRPHLRIVKSDNNTTADQSKLNGTTGEMEEMEDEENTWQKASFFASRPGTPISDEDFDERPVKTPIPKVHKPKHKAHKKEQELAYNHDVSDDSDDRSPKTPTSKVHKQKKQKLEHNVSDLGYKLFESVHKRKNSDEDDDDDHVEQKRPQTPAPKTHKPKQKAPKSEQKAAKSEQKAPKSEQKAPKSEQKAAKSEQKVAKSEQKAAKPEQKAPQPEQETPKPAHKHEVHSETIVNGPTPKKRRVTNTIVDSDASTASTTTTTLWNPSFDGTELLFLGYAKTLKQFAPKNQAVAKMKIAKIIMEQELLQCDLDEKMNSFVDEF